MTKTLTALLVLTIGVLCLSVVKHVNDTEDARETMGRLEYLRDELGRETVRRAAAETSTGMWQHRAKEGDSAALALQKRIGSIERALFTIAARFETRKVDTLLHSRDSIVVVQGDTLRAQAFDYSDGFLTASNLVYGRMARFKYTYSDRVVVDGYWQRAGWFRAPRLVVQARMENPNAHFTNLEPTYFKPKARRWHLGLSAGYGLTQHGLGWFAGPTITYTITQ